MKIRLLIPLAGLAISFALPTFAQQTNTPDPQIRQQLVALVQKFDDAYNNNDPAALVALYTEDAVLVTDTGQIYGREAIEKYFVEQFQKVHFSNAISTLDQSSPHILGTAGNEVWETGAWTQTLKGETFGPLQLKGYHSSIAVLDGGVWKKRLLMWNITPAPATTKTAAVETK